MCVKSLVYHLWYGFCVENARDPLASAPAIRDVLAQIEQELREGEAELSRLTKRIEYLRQAAAGLRGLLPEDEPTHTNHDLEADGGMREARSSQPRRQSEADHVIPDSYDAVRVILQEKAGEGVHIDEVRKQFRERGWMQPDWSRPDSAVYAALVRAEKRDEHVQRVARRVWSYIEDLEHYQHDDSPDPTVTDSKQDQAVASDSIGDFAANEQV
jgi:hypothetical protein